MIRVLVVAPALAVRAGLRALLGEDQDIEITGETAGLTEVRDAQNSLTVQNDVLVIHNACLSADEAEAGIALESVLLNPEPAAVLLLVDGEPQHIQVLPGLNARAWGALPLDCSQEELIAAVKSLHNGLLVGTPALLRVLWAAPSGGDAPRLADPASEALTERELQVLELLAQGMANKQIAVALEISEHTVKFHVSSIYTKLGATSRTEAVRLGVRQGSIVL